MGILELTPSIRADTEAFNKALDALNLTRTQFNRKLKRLGISLGDPYSKTNYMNKLLRDAGKSELQYKNVISKNRPGLTTKGKVEVGMGGKPPGTLGAPANKKIWSDGAKIQKAAEKKFKNVTDQRKFFVDTMKKLYKNVPKSQILHIFKNIIRGIKSVTPIGIAETLSLQMMEDPDYMKAVGFGKSEPLTYRGGGIADIDYMTRPLKSYAHGGLHEETIPSKHQFSPNDMNAIKEMLKSEMLRQNSSDINTDKIAYQFMAEMGYKATEENLKGIRDAITMGMFDAQDELKQENTSDLGKLVGTAQGKYQTFKESDDKMRLIGNKLGLGSLWQ